MDTRPQISANSFKPLLPRYHRKNVFFPSPLFIQCARYSVAAVIVSVSTRCVLLTAPTLLDIVRPEELLAIERSSRYRGNKLRTLTGSAIYCSIRTIIFLLAHATPQLSNTLSPFNSDSTSDNLNTYVTSHNDTYAIWKYYTRRIELHRMLSNPEEAIRISFLFRWEDPLSEIIPRKYSMYNRPRNIRKNCILFHTYYPRAPTSPRLNSNLNSDALRSE